MSTSKNNNINANNTNEADIIFNRANVALARSQRLVASWLPPKTDEELANSNKTEEELQREEDELFTPVPEKLGLGAPLPQQGAADGSWNRTELSSNDKLRQQLLGKNYRKKMQSDSATTTKDNSNNINKRRPDVVGATSKAAGTTTTAAAASDDEEEEQGRSALGRSKKTSTDERKPATEAVSADEKNKDNNATKDENDDGNDDDDAGKSASKRGLAASSSKGKRAGTFLDELLSDRSRKKRKGQK
ncbi:hypothetical protein VTN96DRAFT_8909 [Rasamsonia emersonii]|uniref:Uncharacterized protein n=1 Tax=Rasamsonia emersonii (strain ATCC 16479 / CBS 393.64 / IMI 116815) TaxID=1408163 RepID=A0A0F4YUZ0_RASE3|nr:hypothetical protein T310_3944 [Rasamsonia emersonii CBS 393.64]KKA22054.1 hypothetical protein T310_3944 [Rasamsonia emersonii CBS 393.64]